MLHVQRFAELTIRKRDLQADLDAVNKEIEAIEPEALEYMMEEGLQNVKLQGGGTVFLRTDVYASLIDDEAGTKASAHMALKRARLGYLVKPNVNAQSLSAAIRELRAADKGLPPSVVPWVKITDTPRLRFQRS